MYVDVNIFWMLLELKKPRKVANVEVNTNKPLLYVEDPRLPTMWPGDRIRIQVVWTPPEGKSFF